MRVLIRFSMPAGAGNRAIADGRLGPIIGQLAELLRPEATYFMTLDGRRTGMLFCDLPDVSFIPVVAEPLFNGLDAEVDFIPVMSPADLQAGLAKAPGTK
jgi:hypothetical protein